MLQVCRNVSDQYDTHLIAVHAYVRFQATAARAEEQVAQTLQREVNIKEECKRMRIDIKLQQEKRRSYDTQKAVRLWHVRRLWNAMTTRLTSLWVQVLRSELAKLRAEIMKRQKEEDRRVQYVWW